MRLEGFPRRFRLSRRREFLRVQRAGRKLHTRHFLVFVLPREREELVEPPRVGITVTRKVAHAVGRNRIKRLVREAFRRARSELPPGIDLVWVAKRDAATITYPEIVAEMGDVVARLEKGRSGRR